VSSEWQLDDVVSKEIETMVVRVKEAILESQTEVMRAFTDIARSVETRLANLDELADRMGRLEERIAGIERGSCLRRISFGIPEATCGSSGRKELSRSRRKRLLFRNTP
jgi:hypothetical protein